jgi:hypothetical protein
MIAAHHKMVQRIKSEFDFHLSAWMCDGKWEAQAEAWGKGTGVPAGRKVSHRGVPQCGVGEAWCCDTQAMARCVAVFRLAGELYGTDAVADECETAMGRLAAAADAAFNARCGL